MKKRILSALGILLAFLFILSSCTKPPVEESQENYNYDKIIPVVLHGIQGSKTAIKTNTKTYSLDYYRGGSTWTWTATGADVVPIEGSNGNEVKIFFNQDSIEVGGPVVITVTETTQGGITSDPATLEVMVSPFVITVSGPDLQMANGTRESTFSTPHDVGATYAWSVVGAGATITDNNDGTADITWDVSATDIDDVGVRCVKTFLGLTSVPDTAYIDLWGYVARTRDDFIGTYSGLEDGGSVSTFTTAAGATADELVFEVDAGGLPAFYESVYLGWGEYFIAGHGNDGNVYGTMNMTTGDITIATQYWGATNWGVLYDPPYKYHISGEGFWGGNLSFYLKYKFRGDDEGVWYTWDAIFTKQ